ncbi:branched-chain amino acid transport system II carrier protein [Chlamydia sp.]|uniref:branched-chain amino acid transport system II carrier protein n=1 Tax=Chlamydia sp. TaxID=35827 RepID=UPI0025B8C249|nr:branched-chain amino acid transport system II carrier protein [Chlamydia sp.]MBQ8498951.1 branched-chain amino acid transport system II carrier protein [Chlamydia sp.]
MHRKTHSHSHKGLSIWSIGGSIFAMFFGAGNVVFPLALGHHFYHYTSYACLGMILTAVLTPLLGLFAMMLYSGDYRSFFSSIGRMPGMVLMVSILCIIGPFGGIPRTIAVSYDTLASLGGSQPGLVPSLPWFSLIFCTLVYLFVCKLSKLIQWLGSVFFPIMLATLSWLIIKGLLLTAHSPSLENITFSKQQAFVAGLTEGFNTMDLLAAFFFCSIVLVSIQQFLTQQKHESTEEKPLEFHYIGKSEKYKLVMSFLLAAALLSLVYLGFAFCAARHAGALLDIQRGQILGRISSLVVGPNSFLTGLSVFLACLTTAIAATGIFADFIARVVSSQKMNYSNALIVTLIPTYLVSILSFENISKILIPILEVSYPALIALTCGVIAKKLWNFQHVKTLFYLVFALTVIYKLST